MSPAISIVLRSHNDGWCIRETVEAIRDQTRTDFELIAVDNASADGSAEYLEKEADRFIHVPADEYEPGPVLNRAVESATAPIVVLINSDATPQHREWLERLVAPLERPEVAACYGRQIARPDAFPTVAFDLLRGYPPEPRDDGVHFFSFVSAAFRKSHWETRPFWNEGYAEDYEWTLHLRRQGHELAYVADSVVMHSHNYTRQQMWRKKYRHGWADAQMSGRATALSRTAFEYAKDVVRDILYCVPRGHWKELLASPFQRWRQRYAFYRGSADFIHQEPGSS